MPEQITNGIYRIQIPLPGSPLRNLNSYFIRGAADGHDLLIDTGFNCPECAQSLEEGLAALGADKSRLDVLATHMHSDHNGMSDKFAGPDCTVYMGSVDFDCMVAWRDDPDSISINQRMLQEGFPPELHEQVLAGSPAEQMTLETWDERFTSLADGQELVVGEHTLKVIRVPGHTPGQIMLWIEAEGIMITGDHVLFDITPNITAWSGFADSLGDYLDSLAMAKSYPVKIALPGHREAGDYHARIDALMAHHERRLNSAHEIVMEEPGLTAYDIAGRMRWKIRAATWDDFPVVQKHFAVGECMSHLDYLTRRGKIRREETGGFVRYYPV